MIGQRIPYLNQRVTKMANVFIHLRNELLDDGKAKDHKVIEATYVEMFHDRIEFYTEELGHREIIIAPDGEDAGYDWFIDDKAYMFCSVYAQAYDEYGNLGDNK